MAKHKYIENPETLWQLWLGCKAEIIENPIRVQDYVGKDAEMVYREKQRPFTYEALKVYANKKGLTVNHYFENTNNAYNEYCDVCRAIKDEIRLNQVEGGMVGIFNPSITQRLNNLVEQTENKTILETGIKKITVE